MGDGTKMNDLHNCYLYPHLARLFLMFLDYTIGRSWKPNSQESCKSDTLISTNIHVSPFCENIMQGVTLYIINIHLIYADKFSCELMINLELNVRVEFINRSSSEPT